MILDPGFNLTLRLMQYPTFYDQYRNAIKNTWTVEEVDLFSDTPDLNQRLTPAERHLISRLVAFATGDSESLRAHQFARSAHVSLAAAL